MFDRPALCNRISALLKERNISKTQIYEDCGITSAAFSLWNKEKATPMIQTLEKVADYLDVPFESLFIDKYDQLMTQGEQSQITAPSSQDRMSYTEHVLVNCWRRASEDDKAVMAAVLKKYGFSYSSEKREETAIENVS